MILCIMSQAFDTPIPTQLYLGTPSPYSKVLPNIYNLQKVFRFEKGWLLLLLATWQFHLHQELLVVDSVEDV